DIMMPGLDGYATTAAIREMPHLWEGQRLKGWPVMTFSRGRQVYADGRCDESEQGGGRCVNRPASEPA
ncbi:hypothetical protein AB0C69_40000, partial [Actinomadura sp. NPDC048032]|uniref:hypothetical protein n=1 Tax=Actinomadura sp. NPDC048032 TaxID=3155747 RepID=UPI0033C92FA8